jgi:hypothetical protein
VSVKIKFETLYNCLHRAYSQLTSGGSRFDGDAQKDNGPSDSDPFYSFLIATLMTLIFTIASIKVMENGKKIKQ